ncbi:hypothetical protein MPSEU_000542000 [Mayamaea pseudoterrestris]|nr:hypothetical protein MPSEU_000542000 [Mayamaea pseudoterrestris]
MTYTTAPDLVILVGVRPMLSAVGLSLIVGGTWQMQRSKRVTTLKEQELPTTATPTATTTLYSARRTEASDAIEQAYAAMSDDMKSHSMDEASAKNYSSHTGSVNDDEPLAAPRNSIICHSTLEVPFRSLLVCLLGWFLFGLSCLTSPKHYDWWSIDGGTPIVCFVLCLLLACHLIFKLIFKKYDDLEIIILQDGVFGDGENQEKGNATTTATSASEVTTSAHTITLASLHNIAHMLLLLILASLLGSMNVSLTGTVAAMGGLSMGIAPYLTSQRTVFHLQGPFLVFGAWMVWMGMNAIAAEPNGYYLPVFFGSRTTLAIFGTIFLMLVMWTVGYAQETDPTRQRAFGIHKLYFGSIWEIRIVMVLAWIMFGAAVFLPYVFSAFWSTILFLLYVVLGYSMGMWYEFLICTKLAQSSVVEQMNERAQKWSKVAVFTLLLIVVFMSASATYSTRASCIVLANFGGILLVLGQVLLMRDSKIVGANSQQTISYGSPLTMFALILLCWAISLPTG